MNELIKKILGTSPKTTIVGYLTAIFTVAVPIIQDGSFDFHKDWKNLLIAIGAAIWGRVMKDSNGITAKQSQEMHNVVSNEIKYRV